MVGPRTQNHEPMNPEIAKRQAAICATLVREMDRLVLEERRPADQCLKHVYRQHPEYGSRDRNFYSNAVFSWFRWRGWLKTPTNANIALAILMDASEIPPQMEFLLEGSSLSRPDLKPAAAMGIEEKAEYLQRLLNLPAAPIDECRNLAEHNNCSVILSPDSPEIGTKDLSHTDAAAEIPRFARNDNVTFKLPCRDLVPSWFFALAFIPEHKEGKLHLKQCIEAFQTRPPTWLRLSSGRENDTLNMLAKSGYEIGQHPLLKQAVFVKGSKKFDATQFPAIEVQDLASQCVGLCCNPKAEESWWDMCSGSGGKSLHLADLMHDRGAILATDVRPAILEQLSKRLKKSTYHSIKPLLWDGVILPPSEPYGDGTTSSRVLRPVVRPSPIKTVTSPNGNNVILPRKNFDGILIDAPCSGIGTWHRNPDARWRIEPEQIGKYAEIQKNLLETAAPKLKAGGKLVYSTCTLTKTENIDLISGFLEQHREFRLEKLINPLNHEPTNGIIWIWPWEGCNGMFVAVMRKIYL